MGMSGFSTLDTAATRKRGGDGQGNKYCCGPCDIAFAERRCRGTETPGNNCYCNYTVTKEVQEVQDQVQQEQQAETAMVNEQRQEAGIVREARAEQRASDVQQVK